MSNSPGTIGLKKSVGEPEATYESEMLSKVSSLTSSIYKKTCALEKAVLDAKELSASGADSSKISMFYREKVFAAMGELRACADELEVITPKEMWPFPSYGDLLYSVR